MRQKLKRGLILILGWGLILVGVIGIFLPLLQGLLFIAFGLYILSFEYHWVKRILKILEKRYPGFKKLYERMKEKGNNKDKRV